MPAVTGIVKIYVDGAIQRSKEGAKLNVGGFERTAVVGHEVYGDAEKLVPAQVECTLVHMAGMDLIEISNWRGVTIKFETDTGDSYIITDGFTTKPAELTGGEGEVALEMQGKPATRQT